MIPSRWLNGEVSVLGLGRTGLAMSRWLAEHRVAVYGSDVKTDLDRRQVEELEALGVCIDLGHHDVARVTRSRAVIVSPGIPPNVPVLRAAREASVPISSEIEVAFSQIDHASTVVITGTNGKTTTTALVTHILQSSGVDASAGGNIGQPLIEMVAGDRAGRWLIVEASSFQLHDSPSLHPSIGVLTNLAPDHLDRYPSLEDYYEDKSRLFRNADTSSTWIVNGDDAEVATMCTGVAGSFRRWSVVQPADAWFDESRGVIILDGQIVLSRDEFPLLGVHNVANALAAILVAQHAGLNVSDLQQGLRTFRPLRHRLEPVATIRGTMWINDSKATNVASAVAAVSAMTAPYVLLLGGRAKQESLTPLVRALGRCRSVVVFGESAERFAQELEGQVSTSRVETLVQAVETAADLVSGGDSVLLSPACASYDQFSNYEHRGDVFRSLVEAL